MESEKDFRDDGSELEPGYGPAARSSGKCQNCGATIPAGNLFCYMCGTTVEVEEGLSAEGAQKEDFYPTFLESPARARFQPQPPTDAQPNAEPGAAEPGTYYPPRPHVAIPLEEYENKKKKKIKIRRVLAYCLLAVVLGSIVVLSWQDRGEVADFVAFLKRSIANLFEQRKQPPSDDKVTAVASAPKPETTTHHARSTGVRHKETEKVQELPSAPTADFMPVKVEGQPSARRPVVNRYPRSGSPITRNPAEVAFKPAKTAWNATPEPDVSPLQIEVSPRESLNFVLKQVSPAYPPAARAAGVEGAVVLKTVIGKDGLVQRLEPISGDPMLASAAIDAVKQWRYRPYFRDGEPQQVQTLVVVEFSLADNRVTVQRR